MRGARVRPERCCFLRSDFNALLRRIEEVRATMRALGAEMGRACNQTSETFHDNFAYEDGERRQFMWGEELRKLTHMRDATVIVDAPTDARLVRVGCVVTVFDHDRERTRTFRVGSYLNFDQDPSVVSYPAPLARIVMGAEVGDVCEGVIQGRAVELEVVAIDLPGCGCQDAPSPNVPGV